jgi:hypothetical protein
MRVPVKNIAATGVVTDQRDYMLEPNAWTGARNVRFADGMLMRGLGSQYVLDPPSVAPYWLLHCFDSSRSPHWLYAGLGKVYTFTSGSHTDITKAATTYGATADGLWNGGVLGNIPVINNGVDKPQAWSPVSASQLLVDLPNWPATHTAKIIRAFKNFLFALDITEGSNRFPHRVRVSHPAAPGALPSSWDDTDATKDVFTLDLSDVGAGGLLDAVGLRDIMVLYKERSTFGMQFIGGRDKWRVFQIFEQSGLLGDHCAVAFNEGTKHFVATGEDVIVHNGQQRQSIVTKRLQRWLQANISSTNYHRSFCTVDVGNSECLFCFPLEGDAFPTLAMVWHWHDNTVTFRELTPTSFIAPGQIPSVAGSTSWDSDPASWDSDTETWDVLVNASFVNRLVSAIPGSTKLEHLDLLNQRIGSNYTAYVERTGLDLMGLDRYGNLIRDKGQHKLIRGIWLYASGAPFQVELATQQEIDGAVTWTAPQTFTPGVDEKVDFAEHCRLYGVRFSSTADAYWEISGYEIDVEPLGLF